MAAINLSGPYSLDTGIVDLYVKSKKGLYVLTNKDGTVKRVGRSDGDFANRIKSYVGGKKFPGLTEFWFQSATAAKEAFELECFAYHKWGPSMNDIHPDRPDGTDYECPVSNCTVLDS